MKKPPTSPTKFCDLATDQVFPHAAPIECNSVRMAELVKRGVLKPGDCVCVQNGERGLLNFLISHVQKRALKNLYFTSHEEKVMKSCQKASWKRYLRLFKKACGYSHIATIVGSSGVAELYSPKAQTRHWQDLCGSVLLIRRPKQKSGEDATDAQLSAIAAGALDDVEKRVKYPTSELIYYLKWMRRLYMKAHFWELFKSSKFDVCSGRYIHWAREHAKIDTFQGVDKEGHLLNPPEAWYPGRFCANTLEFRTVLFCRIVPVRLADPGLVTMHR